MENDTPIMTLSSAQYLEVKVPVHHCSKHGKISNYGGLFRVFKDGNEVNLCMLCLLDYLVSLDIGKVTTTYE